MDIKKQMEENMASEVGPGSGFTITRTDGPVMERGYRPVKIERVANGFIVEIGCKKFVGENWEVLAKKLGEYWKDPAAAEKKYCK
jgi:hypothetical protein